MRDAVDRNGSRTDSAVCCALKARGRREDRLHDMTCEAFISERIRPYHRAAPFIECREW
jgi:hypothetical protein